VIYLITYFVNIMQPNLMRYWYNYF